MEMSSLSERLLLRATFIFLLCCFVFKLEFWPVSHYPVFSTPVMPDGFVSYRFVLQYQDGSVTYPLTFSDARRLDVYLEHEFDQPDTPHQSECSISMLPSVCYV